MRRKISGLLSLATLVLILSLPGMVLGAGYEPIYDLIGDGCIDWFDLGVFTDQWLLDCSVEDCNGANFDDGNNTVDANDFALFALYWLEAADVDSNLIGWYKFDKGSGDIVYDYSGNGNNGTITDALWDSGKFGGSLYFTDDYVTLPDNMISSAVDKQITIAFWQYGDGLRRRYIFQTGDVTIYFPTVTDMKWVAGGDEIFKAVSDDEFSGQWHHWVFTKNGDTGFMAMYLDSELWHSGTGKTAAISGGVDVKIGSSTGGSLGYHGRVDDFRIYNRWLGESEIKHICGRASNPSPADNAEQVAADVALSWLPADYALSHDVYFGTSRDDVVDANNAWPVASGPADPNVYKGNQEPNLYDPCGLESDETYYWRIDEVSDANVEEGLVWRLNTVTTRTPAFPGAEGAGKWAVGGRGGTVYEVTDLNDSGPGTLRAAVEASGPRIVVFRVSGTIALLSRLNITDPCITIAGQTAPGDGICLKDYGLKIDSTHDVIVRYIRVRPADNVAVDPDSIAVYGSEDVMLDHCSASWSVDETLSVTHSDNVTVQWCMISESLDCSTHSEGCHGYASLIRGKYGAKVSYHHNLYAHHTTRCPRPGGHHDYITDPQGWSFDFRNNVIYNWGSSSAGYNSDTDRITKMNFIGNYYKQGPDSSGTVFLENCTYSKAYFDDNWKNGSCPSDPWSLVGLQGFTEEQRAAYKQSTPLEFVPVTTDAADVAYSQVLAGAGVTVPLRDSVDSRIVNDVIDGTGGIIDDEDEVSGWPVLNSTTPPADTDHDGMPDDWEVARSLNPSDPSDGPQDRDSDGYTNVEEYINGIPWP